MDIGVSLPKLQDKNMQCVQTALPFEETITQQQVVERMTHSRQDASLFAPSPQCAAVLRHALETKEKTSAAFSAYALLFPTQGPL